MYVKVIHTKAKKNFGCVKASFPNYRYLLLSKILTQHHIASILCALGTELRSKCSKCPLIAVSSLTAAIYTPIKETCACHF
jgi:hypothetical protein